MKIYTAMIANRKSKTIRSVNVFSFTMNGLRTRVESLYLKSGETLTALFPADRMETADK